MSEHTIIKDVTAELVSQLRKRLVPKPILSADSIGAAGEFTQLNHILSVALYNIVKTDPVLFGDSSGESLALTLEYMIAAESKDEANVRPFTEQGILGAVLKAFNDTPVISGLQDTSCPVRITLNDVSLEDKLRIYPKSPALFYQVSPVIITPAAKAKAARVVQVG
jgi:hypothetical protein